MKTLTLTSFEKSVLKDALLSQFIEVPESEEACPALLWLATEETGEAYMIEVPPQAATPDFGEGMKLHESN